MQSIAVEGNLAESETQISVSPITAPESETLSLTSFSKGYQGGPGAMWQGEDLSVDAYGGGNTNLAAYGTWKWGQVNCLRDAGVTLGSRAVRLCNNLHD